MSTILVTGGCGYIGSHTIVDLVANGFEVVSVDNNVRSNRNVLFAIEEITGMKVENHAIDICDLEALRSVFRQYKEIKGIIHFAAYKSVPESIQEPLKYYQNNINGLLNVLTCIKERRIPNFIFSSSCSVYGNAEALPVFEHTTIGTAESPYAYTKQMGERIIQDFAVAEPCTNHILLRYFNPGGSHPSAKIGEVPQKGAYNVIPLLVEALLKKRPPFVVTGNDHNTPDGSCIRDYIHVMDVASAHTKALQYLLKEKQQHNCEVFNIGIGKGVSVLELIAVFEQVTGQRLDYSIGSKRAGDISAIYADATKAMELLEWKPKYKIDEILSTTWKWYHSDYKIS
ncbi:MULTISPECIES: UDP-glucose 4-epimerase GalE [unclassified Aureispira]|uniref:UDP-glucose 4-epimerase GalE n=1 Tax=unclassified Aureispira TaxID=2649989 RepID=UPI00069766AC|nr:MULTISPECIES: UDP-glucose 4-epimerase GalE [unclassified Aureispira]WMX15217.1 UDP-glucose 4-epimerase GalE [Aureispira sp. CCB-E]